MSNGVREILRLDGICKSYQVGLPTQTDVLHNISFQLDSNDFAALVGPSGSGKSTLLNVMGLLDQPTAGELYLLQQATSTMTERQRTELRGSEIGFVFQFHHLIQAFSALDNVLMPLMLNHGKPTAEDRDYARHLLAQVGLEKLAGRRPSELSGGQQQRVAVARALVTKPALILADEPTGNLDSKSAATVFELFRKIQVEYQCAVLLVTHDERLSSACERTIQLFDGRLQSADEHQAR